MFDVKLPFLRISVACGLPPETPEFPVQWAGELGVSPNDLPQFHGERPSRRNAGVYAGLDFSEREDMQNQQNIAGIQLGRFALRVNSVAKPKVILMVVGLSGLFLDLFIQPISLIGLGLILLATAPWIMQAWSQRLQPAAAGVPRPRAQPDNGLRDSPSRPLPEQRNGMSGQKAGVTKSGEPSLPARSEPRRVQTADTKTRQPPLAVAASAPERRPLTSGNSQIPIHAPRPE